MLPAKVKKTLEKQNYAIVRNHSAVQICKWTKSSLNGKGGCWKEKFYGIESHRCAQISTAVMFCENKCLHCWRPIEMNLGIDIGKCGQVDEPKEILEGIIEARKRLLSGFGGNEATSKKKLEEAMEPTLFTLSLSGEATLYPKLSEMIKEIRKRGAVSFLVTNGQNPEALKKLEKDKALPTQLTISMNAPNEKLFKIWHNSVRKDAWERFIQSLKLMKKLKGKTRRAIRLTLVREGDDTEKLRELSNMRPENAKEYADLIRLAEPDFIHVKGFKSLGYSRQRLGYSKQPIHPEIKDFAQRLAKELKSDGYKILAEEERSCVFVLGKSRKEMKIQKKQI